MTLPVSLADARSQLRLEEDDQSRDADLVGYIADAAAWVENYTGHILVARDVTEQFRGFEAVDLRAWPIKPAAVAGIAYLDASGSPIAVTGAVLDTSRRPASAPSGRSGIASSCLPSPFAPATSPPTRCRATFAAPCWC
jgi:hypothetical protein